MAPEVDAEVSAEHLLSQIHFSHLGYLLFDDTVLDKRHPRFIEMVRRQ